MKRILPKLIGILVGLAVIVLRLTCRVKVHNDPRPRLKASGIGHVYAMLHAQQVAASMSAERGTGAMVSRSGDGEIIVPSLRVGGHVPIRGGGGKSRKGGVRALHAMIKHVKTGLPGVLAVDGPRGPRGHVYPGIALLSQKTGAAVLTPIVVPTRRWILKKTWDRLQIPMPFCRINAHFGEPLLPIAGESSEEFSLRIQTQLNDLEWRFDPEQAQGSQPVASTQQNRVAA